MRPPASASRPSAYPAPRWRRAARVASATRSPSASRPGIPHRTASSSGPGSRRTPLADDGMGGMPSRVHEVAWEVAEDDRFARIARRDTAPARPDGGHAVHVELGGLRPGREYFYRFSVDGHLSPSGRTRTQPGRARWGVDDGFASCSQYEHGWFTAYRRLAEEEPWCPTANRVSTASDSRSRHVVIRPRNGNRPAARAQPPSRDAGPRRGCRPLSGCGGGCRRTPAPLGRACPR